MLYKQQRRRKLKHRDPVPNVEGEVEEVNGLCVFCGAVICT